METQGCSHIEKEETGKRISGPVTDVERLLTMEARTTWMRSGAGAGTQGQGWEKRGTVVSEKIKVEKIKPKDQTGGCSWC